MHKFNPNDPSLWKDYNPFEEEDLTWDGDKREQDVDSKKSKYPISLWRQIYKEYFEDNVERVELVQIYGEEMRSGIYRITSMDDFDAVYKLVRYKKPYHQRMIRQKKEWQEQWDRENKRVYLFRSPGKDLLEFYDQKINESQYGRATSKDGQKYLPSHIYHLRFEKEYDTDYIKSFVKKHYNRNIDTAEANKVWRLYPWLTDKDHYYFATDTLSNLSQWINTGTNLEGHFHQVGEYVGWSMVYETGTKWLDNSKSIEEIKRLLENETIDEKRSREAFFKAHGNKTFQIWTETFVVITDPNGKEYTFKKKMDALEFIAKDLKNLGLVVKADRITQILRDGKVMMSRPAGSGSGKGSKEWYDAMPGWTFTIDYRPNGYATNGTPAYKINHTIQEAIDRGWIEMPTEVIRKQR